ncbi:MAG: hypothetical protein AAF353_06410 [Pseudomonadota bacterium]
MKLIFLFKLLIFSVVALPLAADEVDDFLQLDPLPDGVVFEIVESAEDDLEFLLPKVRDFIERVRAQAPEVEFAVVSHGREEFALQTSKQSEYADIHKQVQSLVSDDVPVHVCETHAGWYGVTVEDFPDYVDVAPTGPGQIRLYEELGFYLVVVE